MVVRTERHAVGRPVVPANIEWNDVRRLHQCVATHEQPRAAGRAGVVVNLRGIVLGCWQAPISKVLQKQPALALTKDRDRVAYEPRRPFDVSLRRWVYFGKSSLDMQKIVIFIFGILS